MDLLPEPGAAIPGVDDGEDMLLGGYDDDTRVPSGLRVGFGSVDWPRDAGYGSESRGNHAPMVLMPQLTFP